MAERTQESVTLDFKEARGAATGTLANDDRKTFGKALSAFANSAGGLLVFGVEARKGDDNVDCAQAAKPITNIERFKSEATTASGQLLQPRHDGIAVEAIPSQRQTGAGYLLVYVERSERRPHRSEAAGQKQYFKRAGDSSFEMEHYDIEDAFRRTTVAKLSLEWTLDRSHTNGNDELFYRISFWLRNESRVTAHRPYLKIRNVLGFDPIASKVITFSVVADREWTCLECGPETVIHPDRTLVALGVREEIKRYPGGQLVVRNMPQGPFLRFSYGVGCENSPINEGSILLGVEDLHEQAENEYQAMLKERAPQMR